MLYFVVTGGVISGLGKGVFAASLGVLLRGTGRAVTHIKIDPYLNVDANFLAPREHGEVYVLADGSCVDLDFGTYERFSGCQFQGFQSITGGKLMSTLVARERAGAFGGETVQLLRQGAAIARELIESAAAQPVVHVTGARPHPVVPDICVIELGGTLCDPELAPFLQAVKTLSNVRFVHMVHAFQVRHEPKTRPLQESLRRCLSQGIRPDLTVVRCASDTKLTAKLVQAKCVHLGIRDVMMLPDVGDIRALPLQLLRGPLLDYVSRWAPFRDTPALQTRVLAWSKLRIPVPQPNSPDKVLRVGIVGKYMEAPGEAYRSLQSALQHAAHRHYITGDCPALEVRVHWLDVATVTREGLNKMHGVVLPGGFGIRGFEELVQVAAWCRELTVPTLGICMGMQVMCVHAMREAGVTGACSEECGGPCDAWCVARNPRGMNVGARPVEPRAGLTEFLPSYTGRFSARFRNRFSVLASVEPLLASAGLYVGADTEIPGGDVPCTVPALVYRTDQFYVGVQFHPEFASLPGRPAPVIQQFIDAVQRERSRREAASDRPERCGAV